MSRYAWTEGAGRSMLHGLAFMGLSLALLSVPGTVHATGNPVAGAAIAETWCANCHVVTSGSRGSDAAPPFSDIGERLPDGADRIRAWLFTEHPNMPDFNLTRDEVEDVIAYLATLGHP